MSTAGEEQRAGQPQPRQGEEAAVLRGPSFLDQFLPVWILLAMGVA